MKKGQSSNFVGQTLVETVAALAVVIILVSSLMTVSISSIRGATLSRNKTAASQLAYQELERTRSSRDTAYSGDWPNFYGNFSALCVTAGAVCHLVEGGGSWNFSGGNSSTTVSGTTFTVGVNGSLIDANSIEVLSKVTWNDSLGPHVESVGTIFTRWR